MKNEIFSGWCHEHKDCKNNEDLSITALVVIVATLALALVASVFCVMACCGYFKRGRSAGVIENTPPEYEEQTATPDYIQLEDMTVNEQTDE